MAGLQRSADWLPAKGLIGCLEFIGHRLPIGCVVNDESDPGIQVAIRERGERRREDVVRGGEPDIADLVRAWSELQRTGPGLGEVRICVGRAALEEAGLVRDR